MAIFANNFYVLFCVGCTDMQNIFIVTNVLWVAAGVTVCSMKMENKSPVFLQFAVVNL